jgi:hypothetical protein
VVALAARLLMPLALAPALLAAGLPRPDTPPCLADPPALLLVLVPLAAATRHLRRGCAHARSSGGGGLMLLLLLLMLLQSCSWHGCSCAAALLHPRRASSLACMVAPPLEPLRGGCCAACALCALWERPACLVLPATLCACLSRGTVCVCVCVCATRRPCPALRVCMGW